MECANQGVLKASGLLATFRSLTRSQMPVRALIGPGRPSAAAQLAQRSGVRLDKGNSAKLRAPCGTEIRVKREVRLAADLRTTRLLSVSAEGTTGTLQLRAPACGIVSGPSPARQFGAACALRSPKTHETPQSENTRPNAGEEHLARPNAQTSSNSSRNLSRRGRHVSSTRSTRMDTAAVPMTTSFRDSRMPHATTSDRAADVNSALTANAAQFGQLTHPRRSPATGSTIGATAI
jgi:hypothetical protein